MGAPELLFTRPEILDCAKILANDRYKINKQIIDFKLVSCLVFMTVLIKPKMRIKSSVTIYSVY